MAKNITVQTGKLFLRGKGTTQPVVALSKTTYYDKVDVNSF